MFTRALGLDRRSSTGMHPLALTAERSNSAVQATRSSASVVPLRRSGGLAKFEPVNSASERRSPTVVTEGSTGGWPRSRSVVIEGGRTWMI
jgi:hypothetical protein